MYFVLFNQQFHENTIFLQLENLVREMQDTEHGVPVRSQKLFFTDIPAAFMGEFTFKM